MHKTRAIITAAALTAWVLIAPAALASLPSRGEVPDPDSPLERVIHLIKRVVKPLGDLVIPKP